MWTPAPDLDPTLLRTAKPRRRTPKSDDNAAPPADPPWNAQRFADTFGKPEPRPRAAVLDDASALLSSSKAKELLKAAVAKGLLHEWRDVLSAPTVVSSVPRPPKKRKNKKQTGGGGRATAKLILEVSA